MKAYLKGEDGHWVLAQDVNQILDHQGPMVEIDEGGAIDAIEKIESIEGRKAGRKKALGYQNYENNILYFHEPGEYESLRADDMGRYPTEADFEGGKKVTVRKAAEFVSIRHSKAKYYLPRHDTILKIVGTMTPYGEIVCEWNPELFAVLNAKREATAKKVRAKLSKPKKKKITEIKHYEIERVCSILLMRIREHVPMFPHLFLISDYVAACMQLLSKLESQDVVDELCLDLARRWFQKRETNKEKLLRPAFKDSRKGINSMDELFEGVIERNPETEEAETEEEAQAA